MAAILETFLSPFIEICKDPFVHYVLLPIKRRISYPFTFKTKVRSLHDLTAKLKDKRDRLQDSVGDAERNGEVVYENVRNWLSHSGTAIQEAQVLVNAEHEAARMRCFAGLCPSLKTRYQLSKKAEEKASAIDQLDQQEAGLHPISHRPRRQQHVDPSVFTLEALESRLSILKQVMEALKDPNLNRVGVWGMGGVGKSTLAKEVHGLALTEKLFDDVVFVAVSEKPELGEIQKIIAGVLGVNFDVEDRLVRASHLFERIKDKKVLIILDNIWKKIDLHQIGLPTGADGKECKILLTSREKRVLVNEMDAEKEFMLQVLTHEEACSMFAKVVTHAKDLEFVTIAIEVVKKCAGMPLLIQLVAGDLRNSKELGIWEEKLQQLSDFKDEEIDLKVHQSLKSSYKKLIGDEIKSFFLLCALCGQSNIQTEYLLRCSMGLGLFKERPTVKDARKRVYKLINDLQDCCLLMKGDMYGYVKLHDIVRDAALSIACGEKHAFTCRSGATLTELPDKDCAKISLPFCDFQEFSGSDSEILKFECPNAELLLLLTEDISLKVSNSFFEGVTKLKVLDFTGMHFDCLPSSINFLTNMQTLCLHRCHLDNLSIIGELRQLKILSLVDAYIVELPKEIEQLTRLKILDLSNCSKLKVIHAYVLSKLTMLEELYLGNGFKEWEAEGNASLQELEHLSRLTVLEMQVLDHKMIPKSLFFSFKVLENYRIVIGDVRNSRMNEQSERTLELKFKTNIHFEPGVLKLLKEADDLYLDEVGGTENVLYDLDGDGFRQLKYLHVRNVPVIQHFVDSTKLSSCPAFPNLQSLFLNNLMSLENLCNGRPTAGSFSKMKILEVRDCKRLTTLFLLSCSKQEEIVNFELTQLRSLTLNDLPRLRSFCNKQLSVDDPAFQEGVSSEAEPLTLFNRLVSLPNLENLTITSVCCKKIWQDHLSITSSNLTTLIVQKCQNLQHLFTTSMVKSLSQLKQIDIRDCKLIEEIIVTEDSVDDEEETAKICFPKLEILMLGDLRKLRRFCTGHPTDFQSLKELYIFNCTAFTTFIAGTQQINSEADKFSKKKKKKNSLFNGMVMFPKLEVLHLESMGNLANIWHSQLMPNSFSKLKALKIRHCPSLLMVFPPDDLPRFHTLEELRIGYCDSLQEIFKFQESNAEEDTDVVGEFKLRELQITGLDKLKNIWNKDPPTVFTFQELHSVAIYGCDALKNIFPTSIATCLSQLQSLSIERCGVEEIAAKSESAGSDLYFKFPQLTSFILDQLPELKSFYSGRHSAEWPKLKYLRLIECDSAIMFGSEEEAHRGGSQRNVSFQPFFMFEKLNQNLEQLTLHHKDLLRIQIGQYPANCFSKLQVLRLQSLSPESSIILFGFLKTLHSLEELVVDKGSLEELFSDEDAVYVPLKHLFIINARKLKHIWKQDARLKPVTQYLETLTIESCVSLSKIVQSASSFRNLVTLKVSLCRKLESLFTMSTTKTMVNLTEMSLDNCGMMTEVVENDGDETQDEVVFSKLKSLQFQSLPSLTSFTPGNQAFSFPLLEEVLVYKCPQMEIFSTGVLSTPKLRSVRKSKNSQGNHYWEGNLNATISYLFVERLLPQGVEKRIKVSEFPALKEHWHDKHLWRRFLDVESLTVDGCASLAKALSANLLHSLNKLTTLEVRECGSIEEVFDLEGMSIVRAGLLPRLRELRLSDLPMLRSLWNEDPTKILNLRNLTVIKVENCNSLKYAFTQTVSLFLVKLQEVHLKSCLMMEGIIEMEEQVVSEIICPSLTKISIHDCPNLKIDFGRKIRLGKEELDIEKNAPVDRLKVLPNLEELSLDSNSTSNIVDCEFISKVKIVELISVSRKSCLCLIDFLRRLPNLEKLAVGSSSLEELFFLEGHDGAVILPRISYHHYAAFENLTTLEVRDLDKLMSLVPLPVAKSMVQLVRLRVESCDMMMEIVESEEDKTTDEIVFSKLRNIELEDLHSLSSFCPGSYNFNFPSLEKVIVLGCPNMRIFCPGVLRTPKLHCVKFPNCKFKCENYGDLNATIQASHLQLVGFHGLKELKLSKFPILKENWHGPSPCKHLNKIEKLVVDECASFSSALSLNHMRHLKWLRELVVEKCTSVEQVFDNSNEWGIMGCLQELHLIDLPRLRHVWNKDNLSLKELRVLKVQNCSKLTHIFTVSIALSLENLWYLEVKRSSLVEHIITTGDEELTLEDKIIFPSLETISLECLPSLLSFYSANQVLECPSLTYIDVTDCPNMNLFSSTFSTQQESSIVVEADRGTLGMDILFPPIFGGKVAFPNLEELRVEWNAVKDIWSGRFGIPFLGRLKAIQLTCFPGEQPVLLFNFLHTLRVLEMLILTDASLEEITIGEVEAGHQILAHLRWLKLWKLPNLKHLIEQDSRLALVIEHLEVLKVVECGRLEVLISSSVSFQYLTALEVSKCHGLINLMTPATARSLVQLERMVINECEMIQEIISSEADGVEDEIHLSRLKYFELNSLPRLTSFCSGRFNFNVSSLDEVIIRECPKMETFAQGVVTTSKLWRVQTGEYEYEWEWEGSLNDTIRALSMEMFIS
ncbi:uncharacterized protein LOC126687246 isoform X2 [Mercurialis annua]|uniref:uncharacterized protein LOC126687246 isoform X2 n=1 Tax=Mercurialis annua TaxID=3986 RepID=UPI00215E0F3A|nr:uncharacterized protein LOC126687246 isoform X2 [Mercurialis annua]